MEQIIIMPDLNNSIDAMNEPIYWCRENCKSNWYHELADFDNNPLKMAYYFSNRKEAMLFKLMFWKGDA